MKKSNYISPEVVMVDFKVEAGLDNSFKVGEPNPQREEYYGTQKFNTISSSDWVASQPQE